MVNFFVKLRKTIQEENVGADEKVIVGGDFNCPTNPLRKVVVRPHVK